MRLSTSWPAAAALAVTMVVPAGFAPASETGPDLSGTWQFVRQRSDDVKEKVLASVGPGATSGDIRKDAPRLWIRNWLLGVSEKPEAGTLTIEQTPTEFRSGTGEDLRVYYFGRESTRQAEGGGPLRKATVRWEGPRLIVEERAEKGSGRIREVYSLEPGGRTLLVEWHLEHKALREPLDLRLAFDKQTP